MAEDGLVEPRDLGLVVAVELLEVPSVLHDAGDVLLTCVCVCLCACVCKREGHVLYTEYQGFESSPFQIGINNSALYFPKDNKHPRPPYHRLASQYSPPFKISLENTLPVIDLYKTLQKAYQAKAQFKSSRMTLVSASQHLPVRSKKDTKYCDIQMYRHGKGRH